MSVHGETRRIVVAPVGEMVAAFFFALAGAVKGGVKVAGAVNRTLERRRLIAQLADCDDHMLKDMGITRADLRDAAAAPVTDDPTRVLVLRATERRTAARLAACRRAPD